MDLSFNQSTLFINNRNIGRVGCKTESNIFNESESFYQTVIMCEVFGIPNQIVFHVLVEVQGRSGAVAVRGKCVSDLINDCAGKKGIFHIETVFPAGAGKHYIILLLQ